MIKTFPEFTKLTMADRQEYEALINDFPPVNDISFPALMTWWNSMDSMSISLLNDNLVVPYWIPGNEKNSGLSLIGTNKVDESICAIFDYLREKGEAARLVNVPEFVVGNIRYPSMFTFKEDRNYSEYVLPVSGFYPIKNMTGYRRRKVENQLGRVDEGSVVTKSLDLSIQENKDFLWKMALDWQPKGINDYGKVEQEAMQSCIQNAEALGIDNVCLFMDGKLYGFCLYHVESDKRYVSVVHVKATHVSTLGFELIIYMFAKWFTDLDLLYANVCADYGLLRLRMFMLTLGPHNFFRKYKIEPA